MIAGKPQICHSQNALKKVFGETVCSTACRQGLSEILKPKGVGVGRIWLLCRSMNSGDREIYVKYICEHFYNYLWLACLEKRTEQGPKQVRHCLGHRSCWEPYSWPKQELLKSWSFSWSVSLVSKRGSWASLADKIKRPILAVLGLTKKFSNLCETVSPKIIF